MKPQPMPMPRGRILYVLAWAVAGAAWAAGVAFGLWRLWGYESTPGAPARPPARWPAESGVPGPAGRPTLVLLAHPRCPCSRATIGELARLMADCRRQLTATVLVVRPAGTPDGWERTDLWDSAAAIPGVSVRADPDGAESRRFGAVTSGQALLYGADGRLLFAGGLTESRGHAGDNAGRAAVTALVLGGGRVVGPAAQAVSAPVYGCPLFDESSACLKDQRGMKEGTPPCHTR